MARISLATPSPSVVRSACCVFHPASPTDLHSQISLTRHVYQHEWFLYEHIDRMFRRDDWRQVIRHSLIPKPVHTATNFNANVIGISFGLQRSIGRILKCGCVGWWFVIFDADDSRGLVSWLRTRRKARQAERLLFALAGFKGKTVLS